MKPTRQGNERRAAILEAMKADGGPVTSTALAAYLEMPWAVVNYHLDVLRSDGRILVDHTDNLGSHIQHHYRVTGAGA
jgi:predicted ArsR family transcriptional regulator